MKIVHSANGYPKTSLTFTRLVNEPTDGENDYILENDKKKNKEKDLIDKTNKNDRIPKVQIEFKYENDTSVKEKLPIPLVTYEWSDNAEKLANNYPTYLPRLGN